MYVCQCIYLENIPLGKMKCSSWDVDAFPSLHLESTWNTDEVNWEVAQATCIQHVLKMAIKFYNTWYRFCNLPTRIRGSLYGPLLQYVSFSPNTMNIYQMLGRFSTLPGCCRCTRDCYHSSLGSLETRGSLHYLWRKSHTQLKPEKI